MQERINICRGIFWGTFFDSSIFFTFGRGGGKGKNIDSDMVLNLLFFELLVIPLLSQLKYTQNPYETLYSYHIWFYPLVKQAEAH